MDGTRYVTKRMLVALNQLVVQHSGGSTHSVTNLRAGGQALGFVERIVRNELFGQVLYPDLYHQAAAYLFHIVKDHPFSDGNKRTGLVAAITFLEWNQIRFAPLDEDSVFARIDGLAADAGDPDRAIPELAEWLRWTSATRADDPAALAGELEQARQAWQAAARGADEARARALVERALAAVDDAVTRLERRAGHTARALRAALELRADLGRATSGAGASSDAIGAIDAASGALDEAEAAFVRLREALAAIAPTGRAREGRPGA